MNELSDDIKSLILDKIIGDTSWHGGTYSDTESIKNSEKANELVIVLIAKLYENATLQPNAVATYSGKALNGQARNMLDNIKSMCEYED